MHPCGINAECHVALALPVCNSGCRQRFHLQLSKRLISQGLSTPCWLLPRSFMSKINEELRFQNFLRLSLKSLPLQNLPWVNGQTLRDLSSSYFRLFLVGDVKQILRLGKVRSGPRCPRSSAFFCLCPGLCVADAGCCWF